MERSTTSRGTPAAQYDRVRKPWMVAMSRQAGSVVTRRSPSRRSCRTGTLIEWVLSGPPARAGRGEGRPQPALEPERRGRAGRGHEHGVVARDGADHVGQQGLVEGAGE